MGTDNFNGIASTHNNMKNPAIIILGNPAFPIKVLIFSFILNQLLALLVFLSLTLTVQSLHPYPVVLIFLPLSLQ